MSKQLKNEQFIQKLADEVFRRIKSQIPRKYLRSCEVCEMLNISPSVLQQLRINGDLPAVKLSTGTWLYPYQGIVDALEAKTIGRKGVNHD